MDSDSDVSILGDGDSGARSKAKGKGKATDRGKSTKAKGKAKEVLLQSRLLYYTRLTTYAICYASNPMHGRPLTLVPGIPCKKTKAEVSRAQYKT